jgi:hypothetical protein
MARGGKRPGAGRPKGNEADLFKRVSISLSSKTLSALDSYAKERDLTRSAVLKKLCSAGLKAKI